MVSTDCAHYKVVSAGFKKTSDLDFCLIRFPKNSSTALVTTQNQFIAAPLQIARQHINHTEHIRALIINSGNANCGTGQQGLQIAQQTCQQIAQQLDIETQQVLPFSTGVINQPIDAALLQQGLSLLHRSNWQIIRKQAQLLQPAKAIMTTDSEPKFVHQQLDINSKTINIWGIAKGAGMIHPNMATMLSFIWSDVNLPYQQLQQALKQAVDQSFNRISVDGDTSTNDCCTLTTLASGIALTKQEQNQWQQAINQVCQELALSIVKDAEGATKLVLIEVCGGFSQSDCRQVAETVASSPLVKTAFYAQDPNLGRIAAAVGRSGVAMDFNQVEIALDGYRVMSQSQLVTEYDEQRAMKIMQQAEFSVQINLNQGSECYQLWTSDLSHDYVSINADYRS